DESSGASAADRVGGAATYVGAVALGRGALISEPDGAAGFDGSSARVALGPRTTPAAVEAWVATTSGGEMPIFSNRGGSGSTIYVGLDGGRFFVWAPTRSPAG